MDPVNNLDSLRVPERSVIADADASKNPLDQDAFLKIFLAQLEAQDPLNPQDSAGLSSQLAQFSQLEQSVNTTTALGNIGSKLDELIDVTRGGAAPVSFDPVGLIGRRVEFPADTLTHSASGGADAALTAQVPSGRNALVIQVFDEERGQAGVFSVTRERPEPTQVPNPSDPSGDPVLVAQPFPPLTPGEYALRFVDGEPVLSAPDGSGTIAFTRLTRIDGELVQAVGSDGSPLPFEFQPGRTYRFAVQALDLRGDREGSVLETTRSAVAESVRIVDGSARLVAGGIELDPSQITRILDQAR